MKVSSTLSLFISPFVEQNGNTTIRRMVVERIEPVSDVTAGNVLYPRVIKMHERKRHIEQIFEDVRIEKFPHLPSRIHSVYVYPKSEHNYKSVWLNYKYSHSVTSFN